jgi:hypothetical protein
MSKLSRWLAVAFLACVAADRVAAHSDSAQIPTIVEKTAGMEKFAGYFNLYWDAKQGKLKDWLNSPAGGTQVISDQAHIFFAAKQIEQFEKDPKLINVTPPAEPPDGPPIGADDDGDFWD